MYLCVNAEAATTGFTPSYVALDGKVLRFDAYMKEDVPEIPAGKNSQKEAPCLM